MNSGGFEQKKSRYILCNGFCKILMFPYYLRGLTVNPTLDSKIKGKVTTGTGLI